MIMDFEKLYLDEREKTSSLEKDVKRLEEEIRNLKLSYTNSKTAKDGYNEESLVCNDLNNKLLPKKFFHILGNDKFEQGPTRTKTDIWSKNNDIKCQIKKFKNDQFQQLDRHWVEHFIDNIPGLKGAFQMLKNTIEIPLLPNMSHVDKTKPRQKLCTSNYTKNELDDFITLFNENKRAILEYAFFGIDIKARPEFCIAVEYEKDNITRKKIVLLKIVEMIKYLETLDFKISHMKTGLSLGKNKPPITIQRKGGDKGEKSSNQLQIKITLSRIVEKVEPLASHTFINP